MPDFLSLICKKLEEIGLSASNVSSDDTYKNRRTHIVVRNGNKKMCIELRIEKDINLKKEVCVEDNTEGVNGVKNGWLHYCRNDIICYIDPINHIAYMVHWPKLKSAIENKAFDKYYKQVYNKWEKRSRNYYQIPLYVLREDDYVFKCIILSEE